jgi:hypothetical protein
MNLNQRALVFYLPCFMVFAFLLYRLDKHALYKGEPISSLPDGHYSIQSISCLEAGVQFDYSKPLPENVIKTKNDVRELLYYSGNIERKAVIKGKSMTVIFGNKECYAYSQEKIHKNNFGELVVSGSKKLVMIPKDCKLSYVMDGITYQDDELQAGATIALFSEDLVTQLIYQDGDTYMLYETQPRDFRGYGCKSSDKLVTTLKKEF